jgi:hypothetical protein
MLAHAGVGMRYGTDDAVIAELLLRRSYSHLREMFAEFQVLKQHPIEDSIRLDFRGGLRDGLLALGKPKDRNTSNVLGLGTDHLLFAILQTIHYECRVESN